MTGRPAERSRPDTEAGATTDLAEIASHPNPAARHATTAAPPGDVPPGHPGLTPRVLAAIAKALAADHAGHTITDHDGPHAHHWQALLYVCRGCNQFEDENGHPV